jgi:hypothetical protein
MSKLFLLLLLLLTGFVLRQPALSANELTFASADAARELVHLLDNRGINAIAAPDPTGPDRFVAALYFSRRQLLVISARHPSMDGVKARIEMGQFREVYVDLQGTPTAQGKFFVHDAGADGVLSALPGSGAVDVLHEDNVRQTRFNGDVTGPNLTPAEYDAKLATADASYARLLNVLVAALQQAAPASE